MHRDLKPENILYQSPDEDSPLKIADFGLATLVRPNQLMTVACGTPGYVAPEILRGVAYGKEVDLWSIGVVLYILLCGFPPFYDDNNKKLFAQIVNARYSFPDPYWSNISPLAKELVGRLLVVDPKKRLTAQQILEHPWMYEDGSGLNLDHFRPNMKSFNARRRFRSAIRAVQLTQLLKNKGVNSSSKVTETTPSLLEAVEGGETASMMNRAISIDNADMQMIANQVHGHNHHATEGKMTAVNSAVPSSAERGDEALEKIPEHVASSTTSPRSTAKSTSQQPQSNPEQNHEGGGHRSNHGKGQTHEPDANSLSSGLTSSATSSTASKTMKVA